MNTSSNFIQEKTQVPQSLELLPDVEEALSLYISTARPKSDLPNVFLSHQKPFKELRPRSLYAGVRYHFDKAGINTNGRKRGPHSLRMTLASELVAEKFPYDIVRKILGHEDPTAIKHYVEFDIASLRSCAIEVPPVSGKLAAYIGVVNISCPK